MFSMEYRPSQVLLKNECSQGRRKGEGKGGEEKAGQAPERVGWGRARGCRASRQVVGQFSTNGQCCPCRLHPANVATVGWDWTLLKYIMEDQVLGTACVAQGRDHPVCGA